MLTCISKPTASRGNSTDVATADDDSLRIEGRADRKRPDRASRPDRHDAMGTVLAVDPFKCRMWSLHDRMESEINEDTCKAEIESFTETGQLVPVLGRRLRGDQEGHQYELIYGARRLFVARHLNQPLFLELRQLSDRDAIIAMDAENRLRKDLSAYERGVSYARWLRNRHFESQEDIARALNVSASQVSRLMRLARLPAVVLDAFRSTNDICENWGLDLMDALDDPEKRIPTIRAARSLCGNTPRLRGRDVYRKLLIAGARGTKPKTERHDKVILDKNGQPLFRIKQQTSSIAVILPIDRVSKRSLEQIEANLAEILQQSGHIGPRLQKQIDVGEISATPHLALEPA